MPFELRGAALVLSLMIAGGCGATETAPSSEQPAPEPAEATASAEPAVPAEPAIVQGEEFELALPAGITAEGSDGSWVLTDAGGRTVALILEEQWAHAHSLALGEQPTKVAGLNATRTEGPPPEPWDAETPVIVRWRFETDRHIYDVQHRPDAEWVVERWRLRSE